MPNRSVNLDFLSPKVVKCNVFALADRKVRKTVVDPAVQVVGHCKTSKAPPGAMKSELQEYLESKAHRTGIPLNSENSFSRKKSLLVILY